MDYPVVLELSDVTKYYGETTAVSGISVSFDGGKVYGLIGENGSGKSTLLHMISGTEMPSSGSISFCGKPIYPVKHEDDRVIEAVCIDNSPKLIDTLTVAENIMCGSYPKKYGMYPKNKLGIIDWRILYRSAAELLESLNVNIDVYSLASSLSIKEKRIVELIKAYYSGAKIVLFDEPDYSPEESYYCIMKEIFSRIAGAGRIVIFTTHRIDEILVLADHVMILKDGLLVYSENNYNARMTDLLQIMSSGNFRFRDIYPKLPVKQGPPIIEFKKAGIAELVPFDLSIMKGEIFGISSFNAKSRNVVCRAVCGLEPLLQGSIYIYGQQVNIRIPGDAKRLGIGYLKEDRVEWGLQNEFPIAPNISLGNLREVSAMGLLQHRTEERVAWNYIRKFNIKINSVKTKVSCLSTGNQQKVLLSRLLFSDCRILIMEEPTQNIDKSSKIEIYSFMNHFVLRGGTILFASSHLDELMGLCDRIMIIRSDGNHAILEKGEYEKEKIIMLCQ
jgi:ABC-type sugar transport system ATPase subunit